MKNSLFHNENGEGSPGCRSAIPPGTGAQFPQLPSSGSPVTGAQFPQPEFPSQSSQAKVPSESSQAKVPKRKFQAKVPVSACVGYVTLLRMANSRTSLPVDDYAQFRILETWSVEMLWEQKVVLLSASMLEFVESISGLGATKNHESHYPTGVRNNLVYGAMVCTCLYASALARNRHTQGPR